MNLSNTYRVRDGGVIEVRLKDFSVKVKEYFICAKCGDKFALQIAEAKVSARVSALPLRGIPDFDAMGGIWELRAVHTLDGSPECAKVSIFIEPTAKTMSAFLLGILDLGTSLLPLVFFEGFLDSVPPGDVPFQVSFFNCRTF